ncbi:MAG TPA: response regulator [Chloroflexota bacterium]|nr:response regulator [Chloroflexota bacterium]
MSASLGTVLVVDDQAANRELLAGYLEGVPCTLQEAADGEAALAAVAASPPDVILLDVMMPGLDGYLVTERLKADPRTATIPIVLVTALQERADRLRGLEAGADEFLSKPVDRVELVARVRTLLRLKRLRDEREARVAAERARLARVMTYLPDGVLLFEGPDACLALANPAASAVLGWSLIEGAPFAAQPVARRFAWPDGTPCRLDALPLARALHGGEASLGEELLVFLPDGHTRPILVSATPIPTPPDAPRLAVLVCQDVSRLKEAERRQAEFVAIASHELRTPMTSLVGYTELLLHRDVEADTRRVWLETMHEEGLRLAGILNDLLDLARLDSGRTELTLGPQDLSAAISQVLAVLRGTAPRHTLEAHVEPGLPPALADADKLQQILVNLVGNAIKYSPAGGRVRVQARRVADEAEVRVSDEGIGIPPEELPKLFTRFHRVHRPETEGIEGTGLGLALTKELVERHHGRITVASTPGEGTEFAFTLPLLLIHPALAPPRPLVLVVTRASATEQAEALCAQLEAAGYAPRWVRSLPELRHASRAQTPAAVIVGLDAHAALDGWEVLVALRDDPRTAALPVLLVAAWDAAQVGRTLGATEYLVKPVRPQELLAVLRRLAQPTAGAVLAIDDDAPTRALLAAVLRGQGFRVAVATGGVEGLARARAELPAAVILDLMMPDMDGFAVLERLRADPRTQAVPVVVFTGKELTPAERRWLTERSAALLRKAPYVGEDLLAALRRAVPLGAATA